MSWNKIGIRALATLSLLIFLQSCTIFRTHIDKTCASRFVDQYSSPQKSRFILPWKVGDSFTLTQGNCTLESHSFDFKMPIGTPIVAIEDGRVAIIIENFKDNIDNDFSQANLIGIEHEGGIISWYMHLKFQGATMTMFCKEMLLAIVAIRAVRRTHIYTFMHNNSLKNVMMLKTILRN